MSKNIQHLPRKKHSRDCQDDRGYDVVPSSMAQTMETALHKNPASVKNGQAWFLCFFFRQEPMSVVLTANNYQKTKADLSHQFFFLIAFMLTLGAAQAAQNTTLQSCLHTVHVVNVFRAHTRTNVAWLHKQCQPIFLVNSAGLLYRLHILRHSAFWRLL